VNLSGKGQFAGRGLLNQSRYQYHWPLPGSLRQSARLSYDRGLPGEHDPCSYHYGHDGETDPR
jgi:hypothetical protein